MLLSLTLLSTVSANAGSVYVFGDLTPIFDLSGQFLSTGIQPGTRQLFKNLRKSSKDRGWSSILILDRSTNDHAVAYLDQFYSSNNDLVQVEKTLTEQILNDVGLLVIITPLQQMMDGEIAAIKAHLENNRDMLLIGEAARSTPVSANQNINHLLEKLGSSMRVDLEKKASSDLVTNFAASSLTKDIDSIKLGVCHVISGGKPLAFDGNHEPVLAYENLYEQ